MSEHPTFDFAGLDPEVRKKLAHRGIRIEKSYASMQAAIRDGSFRFGIRRNGLKVPAFRSRGAPSPVVIPMAVVLPDKHKAA